MLMHTDPFHELDGYPAGIRHRRPPAMQADAYRQGDVCVCFDLPGISAESIDLTLEQNVLTVPRRACGFCTGTVFTRRATPLAAAGDHDPDPARHDLDLRSTARVAVAGTFAYRR